MTITTSFSPRSTVWITTVVAFLLVVFSQADVRAQDKRVIRVARITIDSAYIEQYNAAIHEQIEAAVRVEPGVLMLYAVHDKKDATHITVFEIYADSDAYQRHLQTPHFKKYKTGTQHMVKTLELTDVEAIALQAKPKL